MIDPVALDRLVHAVATDQRAKFDAPLPDGAQEIGRASCRERV